MKNKKEKTTLKKSVKKKINFKKKIKQFNLALITIVFVITSNNLMLVFLDKNQQVFHWFSSGTLGFKNNRKKTPLAAKTISKECNRLLRLFHVDNIKIIIKGTGRIYREMIKFAEQFNVVSIENQLSIKFNGVRLKKMPRK